MTIGDLGFGGSGSVNDGASRQAAAASTDAAAAKRDVSQMEDELARMKLVCAAVWELLKERAKLTEDDLIAKVAELDAKDGIADGKLTRALRKCTQCHRTVAAKQNKCMYCGTIQPVGSVFEGI